MRIELIAGNPAKEASKQHDKKMKRDRKINEKIEAIKANPNEMRSDDEIKAQAEVEVYLEIERDPSRTEPPTKDEIEERARDIVKKYAARDPRTNKAYVLNMSMLMNELRSAMEDNPYAVYYPFYRDEDFKALANRVDEMVTDKELVEELA